MTPPKEEAIHSVDSRAWKFATPTLLIAVFLLLAACQAPTEEPASRQAPDQQALLLARTPGQPLVRELVAGQSHTYQIRLVEGEFVQLAVDQQGADVSCVLTDPHGGSLLEVDNMAAAWGPEDLTWMAEETGSFHLVIKASRVETGRYVLNLRNLRPAQGKDQKQAAAARLFNMGERNRRATDYLDAIRHYEEALAIWKGTGHPDKEAEVFYRLARIQARQRQWRKAIAYYNQAWPLFQDAGNVRMQSAALHQIGRSYYSLGEIESAQSNYKQALKLRMELGDQRWQAYTLNNLGLVNVILGEFQEALSLYDRSLEKWRKLEDRSEEATTLHSRGRCYLYLGHFQQTLDDLNQALAIHEELGGRRGQARTLTALGLAHQELSFYNKMAEKDGLEKALQYLEQAIEIRTSIGDRPGQAVTLSILGRVYSSLNEESRALTAFSQAREIFRDLGERHREAFVLYQTGSFLFSLGQTDQALEYLEESLPLLESAGRQHEVDALARIALAEQEQGNFEAAFEYIEKALKKNEALRIKPATHELRSSFFALRLDFYDSYIEMLMELHRQDPSAGYAARALAVSERARARSQHDTMMESGADIKRGIDPRLLARKSVLEKEINDKELQRLRLLDDDVSLAKTEGVSATERELRDLLREHEQIRGQIRLSSPTYTALTQPAPLALDEIQRQVLDDKTLLLEFKLGEKRSYLWAVTRDALSSYELPPREYLEPLARQTYGLLVASNRRESRLPNQSALSNLSDILIRPIAHLLAGKRLLIITEGALQYIPFAALPRPISTSHDSSDLSTPLPLAADHEITYMPSASTLAEIRRRLRGRPPAPGLLAVVADPIFQRHDPRFQGRDAGTRVSSLRGATDLRQFERLVFSEQEALSILELVPQAKTFQALGFEASRSTVTSGELSHYQIVHFATHGYVDAEQPDLSRLVLSLFDEQGRRQEEFLFAHEIYDLELPAELVVLSACRTALGEDVRGEGLIGLTQAFMYAGATRALVSLWPVNDQATSDLMVHFYRHLLLDKAGPADALRRAQLTIAGEKRWQAPYYWAGFVIQGDW